MSRFDCSSASLPIFSAKALFENKEDWTGGVELTELKP